MNKRQILKNFKKIFQNEIVSIKTFYYPCETKKCEYEYVCEGDKKFCPIIDKVIRGEDYGNKK